MATYNPAFTASLNQGTGFILLQQDNGWNEVAFCHGEDPGFWSTLIDYYLGEFCTMQLSASVTQTVIFAIFVFLSINHINNAFSGDIMFPESSGMPFFAGEPVSGLIDSRIEYGVLHHESTPHYLTGKPELPEDCTVSVLPGNTEHLKFVLATTPAHCDLALSGTYELYGELSVNRLLKAAADGAGQPAGSDNDDPWLLPEKLALSKDQSGIGVGCSVLEGEVYCSGQNADFIPAARIMVREGKITFSSGGGLHRIGIVDLRSRPDHEHPLLFSELEDDHSLNFRQAVFKGRFPCVSDIDGSHPYWNNREVSDTGGSTANRVSRMAMRFFSGSSWRPGSLRSWRSISSGCSGGGRPRKGQKQLVCPGRIILTLMRGK